MTNRSRYTTITYVSKQVPSPGPGSGLPPHPVVLPAVLVAVGVDHWEDEHIELGQEGVVLALGFHHAVDEVGHGSRTHPLSENMSYIFSCCD